VREGECRRGGRQDGEDTVHVVLVPKLEGSIQIIKNRGSFGRHCCRLKINSGLINLEDKPIYQVLLQIA
jgi:hypothetical protein